MSLDGDTGTIRFARMQTVCEAANRAEVDLTRLARLVGFVPVLIRTSGSRQRFRAYARPHHLPPPSPTSPRPPCHPPAPRLPGGVIDTGKHLCLRDQQADGGGWRTIGFPASPWVGPISALATRIGAI